MTNSNNGLFEDTTQPTTNNGNANNGSYSKKKEPVAYINMTCIFQGEKRNLMPSGIPLYADNTFSGVLLNILRKASPDQREQLCKMIVNSLEFTTFHDREAENKASEMSFEDIMAGFSNQ